eukprot:6426616-Amphidinium_carterae.1
MLLLQGNRRAAQETLRNNERAIHNRCRQQLPGGKATPAQMGRFAEAKARKMPCDDARTTKFIIYGEDPAMAADPQPSEEPNQTSDGL